MLPVQTAPLAMSVEQEHQFARHVLREKTAAVLVKMFPVSATALPERTARRALKAALLAHLDTTAVRDLPLVRFAQRERTARIQLY